MKKNLISLEYKEVSRRHMWPIVLWIIAHKPIKMNLDSETTLLPLQHAGLSRSNGQSLSNWTAEPSWPSALSTAQQRPLLFEALTITVGLPHNIKSAFYVPQYSYVCYILMNHINCLSQAFSIWKAQKIKCGNINPGLLLHLEKNFMLLYVKKSYIWKKK